MKDINAAPVKTADGKRAAAIGTTAIAVYVANYYLRHILGVLTPTLLGTGLFSVDGIAALSSVYMLFYAAGQVANGFLGDILSPKRMAVIGLFVAGSVMMLFPLLPSGFLQIVCFAVLGYGLSMMRGPLMKIISENTKSNHARLICVFFSFSSFAGPLIASLFAMIRGWQNVFFIAGAISLFFAAAAFVVFTAMERRGTITYKRTEVRGIGSILAVFRIEGIAFYLVVACLVEIAAASISQWITTFLTGALGFSPDNANFLYSGISIARSFMPFVALALFRATGERDLPLMRVAFTVSSVMFLLLLVSPSSWVSILLLALALMAMSCSSAMLWSIYIPSLGKTGKVSSANGVIDCIGYIAAALANLLFAAVMGNVGWSTVYVLWASMGAIGLLASFALRRKKKTEV